MDETISGYADPDTSYQLIEIAGKPATYTATIMFPQEGSVTGKGPCNSFSAEQTAPYPWFDVGFIRATHSACPDLNLEQEYFEMLTKVTTIEVLDNVVILRNEDTLEMVFEAN